MIVRTSKNRGLLCLTGLFVSAMLGTALASEPTVELRWALGAQEADGSAPSGIQKDTQLDTGARLKFLVEPLSAGSVYLILLDSSDEIHLLFRQPASAAAPGDPAYVPPGSQWFELDQESGQETFFLLASVEPLPDLEALLTRYDESDPAAKREVGGEIVQEIRRLHKANREFARPVEKPVMIGGQTRSAGSGTSIDRLAVEISAERFYGKTITIDH